MSPMSYIWSTESLSLSVSVKSGYLPPVITAPISLDISSSAVRELLGNQTFYESHSCADKQVTCGNVCISLSVGFIVMTPSILPLEDNRIINSWSFVAIKIGASEKGLSWNFIPYARNLVGVHQGVIHGFTHPYFFVED